MFGRFVREGHGPTAGLAAARGLRDDASIVPYRGLRYRRGCGSPVGRGPCRFVGADSISARGCLRQRGFRRDEGIPPYGRPGGCGCPVGRGPSVGRRGGIYPSRGHLRQREVLGTMQASSPNVVIFRLPFPVPDPIIEYKASIAKDALMDVRVPEMIIKLKQGIGRLIRNFSDTGIVCIIDPRLRDDPPAKYHDIVWESLPIKNKTNSLDKLKRFFDSLSSLNDH